MPRCLTHDTDVLRVGNGFADWGQNCRNPCGSTDQPEKVHRAWNRHKSQLLTSRVKVDSTRSQDWRLLSNTENSHRSYSLTHLGWIFVS